MNEINDTIGCVNHDCAKCKAQPAPVQELRWYCIGKNGMATLCVDENDAKQSAKLAEQSWPRNAPYRAAQLCDYTPTAAQPCVPPDLLAALKDATQALVFLKSIGVQSSTIDAQIRKSRAAISKAEALAGARKPEPVGCQYGNGGYACCEGGPCKADEQNNAAPVQEPLTWYEGAPPFPQDQEWFIAETIYGDRVVLRSLDEGREHKGNYAFKTADQTYMKQEIVQRWMQFPDCEYLPPAAQPAMPLTDEQKVLRSLLGAALGALRYHTEQTRPIQRTNETITAIEHELAAHGIPAAPEKGQP
jgi:hypothetical protein